MLPSTSLWVYEQMGEVHSKLYQQTSNTMLDEMRHYRNLFALQRTESINTEVAFLANTNSV